ncbi:MAG: bifunctional 23S rRNA (guanine(2069)-N(7))-methyltransferase RlmK/23S rRNA (guanine(2445)-N(2))-methyltransferase RlmL [Eggerthellales bacterium]|nr:bifunctional 23S rRNA (guanine(2069)-N(7))-methyltransferase RlmK/23S rRNA (guanine(2445)-N(2))-methyltransferase RlmL [Eggerthellales bacterium]
MREYFASCLAGLEHQLDTELRGLGAKRVRPLSGGVAFFAEDEALYKVCLWSRLTSHVTMILGRISAEAGDELYRGVYQIPWEDILAPGATLAVRAHGTNAELRNTHFTELRVKDAIVDRLVAKTGSRPDVDSQNPGCQIIVRLRNDRASVSFDMTGGSLYRRGYLRDSETVSQTYECALAAGIVSLAKISRDFTGSLVDPCCGQAHVLTEAAMVISNCAPGLSRASWGFYGWKGHQDDLWGRILDEADEAFEQGLAAWKESASSTMLIGCASSPRALAYGVDHVKRAGLGSFVHLMHVPQAQLSEYFGQLSARLQKQGMAVVVASALSTQTDTDTGVISCESICLDACRALTPELQVLAAGEDLVASFGAPAASVMPVGSGSHQVTVATFIEPPATLQTLTIPDSFGGADHQVGVHDLASVQFADRLRKVAKERRKWAKREGIGCYRVYDADLPEYAAAIDLYQGAGPDDGKTFLHIAEYAAPASVDAGKARRRFDDLSALAPVVLGIPADQVFTKVRRRDKGGSQYGQNFDPYVVYTSESGLVMETDLRGYLDTGIFLDHRVTREMVGQMAKGARFLNLFAYTGTATVHAAAGGAKTTTTVDLSQTYLDWAKRNMGNNGFTGPEHEYYKGDVMSWISWARGKHLRYDLIFVDPPTFSNSKAMGRRTWDVQRDHTELLIGVSRLLAKGGTAVFSCNLRSFKPDVNKLRDFGVQIEDITERTIPHDFARNPKIHKCYLVSRDMEKVSE